MAFSRNHRPTIWPSRACFFLPSEYSPAHEDAVIVGAVPVQLFPLEDRKKKKEKSGKKKKFKLLAIFWTALTLS